MGFGLLAALLAACTTEDMKTNAAQTWCQMEDDCNEDIYFPSGPVEAEECRQRYVTEAEKYLDGCDVNWGDFTAAENKATKAGCTLDYDGTSMSAQDFYLDPEVLPAYCNNYSTADGVMYPSAKKAKR